MYDETIQRSARRAGIAPIHFEHPAQSQVISCFDKTTADPVSVILTGTAGDGKTHLCRQVWLALRGDEKAWASDNPYLSLQFSYPKDRKTWPTTDDPSLYRSVTIHFIRDLSGWAPQQGLEWEPKKEQLLQKLCKSLFDPSADEVFLIAANDGQLIESWRRLSDTPEVIRARKLFEDLLVEDRQQEEGVRLRMFNLSRWSSAELFDRAYEAFVSHPGWSECASGVPGEKEAFGPRCPIRQNYELLKTPLVHSRLRALIELCDHNGLHLPIRQILLLLSNTILGHPDCKDHLMRPVDVPKILDKETQSKASIYNNIFGGNLSENRRQSITIFDYFDRFQLGYETSNRIDNILIFGEGNDELGKHFEIFIKNDSFYGADKRYYDARARYIEGAEDDPNEAKDFLDLLVAQRRGLFFKIPENLAVELKLWELTVFRFAGEYLDDVLRVLKDGKTVKRPINSRLIKGLNRIFTGMLLNSERELYLATSGNYSQAKISRVLVDRLSVEPRHGEKVSLGLSDSGRVVLAVHLSVDIVENLELNLVRYEFLSRVATEGALPASFSKECYEDMLAFKSRLLSAHERRKAKEGIQTSEGQLGLRLINVSQQGLPEDRFVEVLL
ncbi:hypothetical protein QPK87_04110 [Kamptonema cortianum]|nr:hypothetical protein [Kamptonema cortianum]